MAENVQKFALGIFLRKKTVKKTKINIFLSSCGYVIINKNVDVFLFSKIKELDDLEIMIFSLGF